MRLAAARRTTLVGWLALLTLVVCWHVWLDPSQHFSTPLVLAVTAAPLLLPLYGLIKGRTGAHLGTAFLTMPYFMHGVVEAYADPLQRLPALAEVALSLVLFLAATLYVRWAAPTSVPGGE